MLMGLGHALDIAIKLGYTETGQSQEAVESPGSCRRAEIKLERTVRSVWLPFSDTALPESLKSPLRNP
jgi:hypothetical protein